MKLNEHFLQFLFQLSCVIYWCQLLGYVNDKCMLKITDHKILTSGVLHLNIQMAKLRGLHVDLCLKILIFNFECSRNNQ